MAALGFWTLLSGARSGRRLAIASAGALLGFYTVVMSVLIGFQGGYYSSFERLNPPLHAWLGEHLSFCEPSEDRSGP